MNEDYNYDVFISYRRSNLIQPWVSNYFLALFKEWLTEHLLAIGEPPPKIFLIKSTMSQERLGCRIYKLR